MAILNSIQYVTIYTQTLGVYMKRCTSCQFTKSKDLFIKWRNTCKDCWNANRRAQNKLSRCRQCDEGFRPGVRGRYKFCSEVCRFMNKVKKDESGCWLWTAGIHKDGYGDFVPEGGRSGLAHRSSYRLFKGPLEDEKLVLHSCHVPRCVNPDHLRLGTDADNASDKVQADRCNPSMGEKHHGALFTNKEIKEIRKLATDGESYASLSRKFRGNAETISNIVRRITWKHI